jgi:hypothetical protein
MKYLDWLTTKPWALPLVTLLLAADLIAAWLLRAYPLQILPLWYAGVVLLATFMALVSNAILVKGALARTSSWLLAIGVAVGAAGIVAIRHYPLPGLIAVLIGATSALGLVLQFRAAGGPRT